MFIDQASAGAGKGGGVVVEQRGHVVALSREVGEDRAMSGLDDKHRGDRRRAVDSDELADQLGVGGHGRRLEVVPGLGDRRRVAALEAGDELVVDRVVTPLRCVDPDEAGKHVAVLLVVLRQRRRRRRRTAGRPGVDRRPVEVAGRELERLGECEQRDVLGRWLGGRQSSWWVRAGSVLAAGSLVGGAERGAAAGLSTRGSPFCRFGQAEFWRGRAPLGSGERWRTQFRSPVTRAQESTTGTG